MIVLYKNMSDALKLYQITMNAVKNRLEDKYLSYLKKCEESAKNGNFTIKFLDLENEIIDLFDNRGFKTTTQFHHYNDEHPDGCDSYCEYKDIGFHKITIVSWDQEINNDEYPDKGGQEINKNYYSEAEYSEYI